MLKKFFFVVFENKYFGLFVNVIQLLLRSFKGKNQMKKLFGICCSSSLRYICGQANK
jgi:hypothetical protein